MYKLRSKRMSNHVNEIIMEGLADEFFDDIPAAVKWLEEVCEKNLHDMSEEEILELFVEESMNMMPDGPQ